jgi:hypothetical protein
MSQRAEAMKKGGLSRQEYDRIYHAVKVSVETDYSGYLDELPAGLWRIAREAARLAEEDPIISYGEAINLALEPEYPGY